jgi:hypothetical protein
MNAMLMTRSSKAIESAPQMRQKLKDMVNKLDKEELNLLIFKKGEIIYSSKKGGMAPLLEAIDQLGLEKLVNSTVVDKIVGKAAALLIAYFKAEEVYTKLLSRGAVKVLEAGGISYAAERVIDYIRDKEDKDICPFERMVLEIEDPHEGYKKIKANLSEKRN